MQHLSASERLRALVALATAIVLFASSFVAIRAIIAADVFSPAHLAVARFIVASALLGVIALVSGGVKVPRGRKDWTVFLLMGACGQTLYQVLLNAGERTVDAGTASLLVSCSPILASVLAVWLLGERFAWQGWLGTAIAFCGAVVIAASAGASATVSTGVLMVVVATLLWAGYQVIQKLVSAGYGPLELTAWPTWIATLVLLPFAGGLPADIAIAPPAALAGIVWLGAGASVGGFLAWSYAIRRLPVVVSSNALFCVPVAASLIGFLALAEVPAAGAILGGAIALGGVAYAQTRGRPQAAAIAVAEGDV